MKPNKASFPGVIYSTEQEDFYYIDVNVPCQAACPAYTNIPAYIRALYENDFGNSYEINRLANIFPGILGRVCSRPCEDRCRHGETELGRPVNICHIKRAAADLQPELPKPTMRPLAPLNKKVAIIGSGPAGLAAAHDLVTIGVAATIYEAYDKPGGMLQYGIPEFRLPREIIKEEIDYILGLGVNLKTGVRIETDEAVKELLKEYDAVLLAAGCYQAKKLSVPGEDLPGVHSGLEFMMDVCRGNPPLLGDRVLVIGAGFTAFDCARSSLRLGSKDVRICLRRTEEDLMVTKDEIREAKREGVTFESLLVSRKIIGNSKVEGVEFARSHLGNLLPNNKREITPIAGSEFVLDADSVIVATGQKPAPFKEGGMVTADRESYKSSLPGLYIAGDYLTGPSTVIEAIAMGRWAAEQIVRDLTGQKFREKAVRMEETNTTHRQRTWDYIPRQEMPVVESLPERFEAMSSEVETGFGVERAKEESKRCYLCYLHYEIDISICIYCRYCIDVAPRDCIKLVDEIKTNEAGAITGFVETNNWNEVNAVVIDNARCIRCGECMRVCPVDCISVSKVELVERLLPVGSQNE